MKFAILTITKPGKELAKKIGKKLPDSTIIDCEQPLAEEFQKIWHQYDGFVCIMAVGIVVRLIAPLLKNKKIDPCVVVLDQKGEYVVSLLSGHLGGGNDLARQVSAITGGKPVITTASDNLGYTALDCWARDLDFQIEDNDGLVGASAKLINQGFLRLYSEPMIAHIPDDMEIVENIQDADIVISHHVQSLPPSGKLQLFPRNLVVGFGCNRDTDHKKFEAALSEALQKHNLARASIRNLASIDLKSDEAGLLDFAAKNNWQIDFFTKDQLNRVDDVEHSPAALRATGAKGVAEPAALLSAGTDTLLVRKMKWKDVTLAIALADFTL